MFTGIIDRLGVVAAIQRSEGRGRVRIRLPEPWEDSLRIGESIAVEGVCLTLVNEEEGVIQFDVLDETFDKTNLGQKAEGDSVNLERAMAFGHRMGGHVVQGHVDGRGSVESLTTVGEDLRIAIVCEQTVKPYLAYKGSIAVNGISLTVASLTDSGFEVHIIPHTWSQTSLHALKTGSAVNLEADILAKYVERHLREGRYPPPPGWSDLTACRT